MTALGLRFLFLLGVLMGLLAPEAMALVPKEQLVTRGFIATFAEFTLLSHNCDLLTKTRFEYDGLNRNTKIIDPLGRFTAFIYDPVNKTQRIAPLGQTTSYLYDQRNRLTTVIYANGGSQNPTRNYTYDAVGNLLTVTEAGKSGMANVAYSYDSLNRQISETSHGITHQYKYDLAGNRLKTTYGGTNRKITSTYDTLNRLETLTANTAVTTYSYDARGNIIKLELPNGDLTQKSYDALNRVEEINTFINGNLLRSTFTYGYDLLGNVQEVSEEYQTSRNLVDRLITNQYDDINRLIR